MKNGKKFELKRDLEKIEMAILDNLDYDTAHGFVHRDLLDIKGRVVKTPLFNQDYNDALTFAESDLKSNWEYYKKRFLEEKYE